MVDLLSNSSVLCQQAPFVINQNSAGAAESATQGTADSQPVSVLPCKGVP